MSVSDLNAALLGEAELNEQNKSDRKQAVLRERQAIFQDQADREREEALRVRRFRRRVQDGIDERARQEKDNRELQAYFVKADARDKTSFLETYDFLYELYEMASKNDTKKQFKGIVEIWGFPWDKLIYSEEERQGLPLMLLDRESMDMALKMGFWPYGKDPLTELVDGLKTLNEPPKTAPIDNAILIDVIEKNPFVFLNLGRTG